MPRLLAFVETDRKTSYGTRDRRIRCPKCRWEPPRDARWSCLCGNVWNTFDTRGVCPKCDAVWAETQCLECHEWSPHEAWYGDATSRS